MTAYVPRFRDMVAMAFFDIVVTLNLFSMLFAAFLVPVVSYVDYRGTVMEVEALEFGSVPERRARKMRRRTLWKSFAPIASVSSNSGTRLGGPATKNGAR
jgi:hypothetical protein